MKKIKYCLLGVGLVLFSFFYYRANVGKPHDIEIKKYHFGEKIEYNNSEIILKKKQLVAQDLGNNEKRLLLPINYEIQNNNNEEMNALSIISDIVFFNGLSEGIAQNFHPTGKQEDKNAKGFNKDYESSDFILKAKEKKNFELYYPIYEEKDYKKFPSCLKFPNSLYWDKYGEKLKNGKFYYEILEWEVKK